MLRAIDHIDLQVPNLVQFVAFFTALGFVEARPADFSRRQAYLVLPGEGQIVFEVKESPVEQMKVDHIAFQVDDMTTDLEALTKAGVGLLSDPHQNRFGTGRTLCQIKDPSGKKWQLAE